MSAPPVTVAITSDRAALVNGGMGAASCTTDGTTDDYLRTCALRATRDDIRLRVVRDTPGSGTRFTMWTSANTFARHGFMLENPYLQSQDKCDLPHQERVGPPAPGRSDLPTLLRRPVVASFVTSHGPTVSKMPGALLVLRGWSARVSVAVRRPSAEKIPIEMRCRRSLGVETSGFNHVSFIIYQIYGIGHIRGHSQYIADILMRRYITTVTFSIW
jgi:hypothetical protein